MLRTESVPCCDCNPYREGVAVASTAERPALRPCFDNLRGAINGYSAKDPSPVWRNREAFIHELTGLMALDEEVEPESWDEVLDEVEQFLLFWKVYYCGLDPEAAR